MPLYEYQCNACGHRFEVIQKFSDAPVETCPSCGGEVRKLLSSPAIQFKGTGWYITDYAKKSGAGSSSASANGASGSGSGEGGGDKKDTSDKRSGDASTAASPAPSGSKAAS